MSNTNQGLRRLSRHRYTIKQLLDLSQEVYIPFDLSKFSFDAARAGVIPPLGDCATASRRSSATRSRIPSSETASTIEINMAYRGGNIQEPERRPQNPPSNISAQQTTGFARFLKKHSSPTHQRVTAGGRIVPIEPRNTAPPLFHLPAKMQMKQMKQMNSFGENGPGCNDGEPNSVIKDTPRDQSQQSFEVHSQGASPSAARAASNTLREPLPTHGWVPPALQPEPLFGAPDGNIATQCLPYTALGSLGVCNSGFMPNQFSSWAPWPSSQFPHLASVYPVTGAWPYSENAMSHWNPPPANDYDVLNQQVASVQNMLNNWSQHYDDLDEKLKALNRHRAMTSLNTDIASERRTLVQQRSDTKDMINKSKTYLENIERFRNGTNSVMSGSTYNVDAPSYVPINHQWPLPMSEAKGIQNTNNVTSGNIFQKPQGAASRRPIPIVPPPKLETNFPAVKVAAENSPSSLLNTPVDEWGVKIGSAPPELKRQQSEMADSLREAFSDSSPGGQSRESLQPPPQSCFSGSSKNLPEESTNAGEESDSDRWMQHQFAHPLPDTKISDADQLFSALRKAKGTVTKVTLSNGSFLDVEGQGLKYLHSRHVSELEERCASENGIPLLARPAIDRAEGLRVSRLATTPVNQAIGFGYSDTSDVDHDGSDGSKKENVANLPSMHRKAATDMFLAHFNGQLGHDKQLSEPNQTQSLHDFGTMADHTENSHHSVLNKVQDAARMRASVGMPSYQQFTKDAYYSGHVTPPDDRTQAVDRGFVNRSIELSSDGFNNKGFSLVSLQNVHAVAQLPQSVDGATDGGKGSKSLFAFAGKVKSPRLLHRSAASNGA